MANTFSNEIDVLGLHRVVAHGTVDDPNNVANVEIFRGDRDLGSAHVSANGDWHLTVAPSKPGDFELFHAIVTDGTGSEEFVGANFQLRLDDSFIPGDLAQILSTDFTFGADLSIQKNYFDSNNTNFLTTIISFSNDFSENTFDETGQGPDVSFLCFTKSQFGIDMPLRTDIANFHVAKASHDYLDLSNGPFSTIAQVLRHTSTFQGSATIHLDKDSTVKLDGVTKTQLAQHRDVFFFG